MSDHPRWRLRTLGSLTLTRDGEVLAGGATGARRLALLAVIAASEPDGAVSRDTLLLYFWPERTEERARSALKQLTFAIRRSLGEPDLFLGTESLRLNPDVISSDVGDLMAAARSEDLEAVVAAYTGPFLDGVHVTDASEFERWAAQRRAAIDQLYKDTRTALALAAERAGDDRRAIAQWSALVQCDGLSAHAVEHLASAFARSGDVGAALRTVTTHMQVWRDEFGAEPDAAVLALLERLRTGESFRATRAMPADPSSDGQPLTAVVDAGPTAPVPTSFEPRSVGKPRRRGTPRRAVGVSTALLVAVLGLSSLVRSAKPASDLVVVPPFQNQTGDASKDMLGVTVANALTDELAAAGVVSVADFDLLLRRSTTPLSGDSAPDFVARVTSGSKTVLVIRGELQRAHDSLVTRIRLVRGGEVVSVLDPIVVPDGAQSDLLARVRQAVLGATAAFYDAEGDAWGDHPGKPPRYDAQVEYTAGLTAAASHGNAAEAIRHFQRAIALDSLFAAPKLQLLHFNADPGDSLFASLNRERERLTRPQQIELEMYNSWSRHDAESAFRWAEHGVSLAPHSPAALLNLQMAAYTTNRYSRAVAAFHSLDRYPAWAEGAQLPDINAHHMNGALTVALREAELELGRHPHDPMFCNKVVEQLAALARVHSADSAAAACAKGALLGGEPVADAGLPYLLMGQELLAHGHEAEADRALARCIALRLEFARAHPGSRARAGLASQCYLERGDWAHAYALLKTEYANFLNPARGHVALGIAAAHVGDTATASAMLRWHEARSGDDAHLWYRAAILVALGHNDSAIELLRRAAAGSSAAGMAHLNNVRAFLPLAADPRFRALLEPVQ